MKLYKNYNIVIRTPRIMTIAIHMATIVRALLIQILLTTITETPVVGMPHHMGKKMIYHSVPRLRVVMATIFMGMKVFRIIQTKLVQGLKKTQSALT